MLHSRYLLTPQSNKPDILRYFTSCRATAKIIKHIITVETVTWDTAADNA